jgi:hypothetical protein
MIYGVKLIRKYLIKTLKAGNRLDLTGGMYLEEMNSGN